LSDVELSEELDLLKWRIQKILDYYEKLMKAKIWRKVSISADKVIIDLTSVDMHVIPFELLRLIEMNLGFAGYTITSLEPHRKVLTIYAHRGVGRYGPTHEPAI